MHRVSALCVFVFALLFSAAAAETVYPIGVVIEKSGALENWGKASEEGMILAAEELKGKDGIVIQLFIEDNKSTPEQSANAFISLANVKNVKAVLAPLPPATRAR